MSDLFQSGWENGREITVDNCLDITLSVSLHRIPMLAKGTEKSDQFSLYVISAAGFGHKMAWKEDKAVPLGHSMSFKTSMYIVTTYVIPKLLLPDWIMGLTNKTREIDSGFKEIRVSRLAVNDIVCLKFKKPLLFFSHTSPR
jgi:hypothetical protein